MNRDQFFEKLRQNPRPVVVDFWAPWCGPCKAIKPVLKILAEQYAGRVDMWEINADKEAELLGQLHVYGIPTLLAYRDGAESMRQVGIKPPEVLKSVFESLATGELPVRAGMSGVQRFLRIGIGLGIAAYGLSAGTNWLIAFVGGAILFAGIYDRCPIWRAITGQFKKLAGERR